MSRLVLASASPRRRELMALAGFDFEVITADVDEVLDASLAPCELVMSLSFQKASAVAKPIPLLPPVITATLSFNLILLLLCCEFWAKTTQLRYRHRCKAIRRLPACGSTGQQHPLRLFRRLSSL